MASLSDAIGQKAIRSDKGETMNWELRTVRDIDWTQDESEVYTIINWRPYDRDVRIDVMTSITGDALMSFAGPADAVRKHTIRWLANNVSHVSLEHASYIGQQLEKASRQQSDYTQD